MSDPGDKLYYGSGEYTSTGPSDKDEPGYYLGNENGTLTIDVGGGDHYKKTADVSSPHSWNGDRS